MARQSKLTPRARARFLQAIQAGAFPEVAARFAGFSPASYYRYMKGSTPEHAEFRLDVLDALAALEVRITGTLIQRAMTDPRWALVALQHRFPERWQGGALPEPDGPRPKRSDDDDDVVILDPDFVSELVPRLLEAGERQRSDPSAERVDVVDFEDRAIQRPPLEGGSGQ